MSEQMPKVIYAWDDSLDGTDGYYSACRDTESDTAYLRADMCISIKGHEKALAEQREACADVFTLCVGAPLEISDDAMIYKAILSASVTGDNK